MIASSFVRRAMILASALALAASFAACGDIIVSNAQDGGSPGDDGGSGGDSGSGDAGAGDGAVTDGDAGVDTGVPLNCMPDADHPTELGCTGLYSDWPSRTIAPDALPFDPGIHLWSDGAAKSRYIYLPPGTKIDTSDLNEWCFPVGTKVWKEFRLLGKPVETRFLWKIAGDCATQAGDAGTTSGVWFRTTYAWSDDGQSATELVGGQTNVLGIGYEIPSTDQCATCHQGRKDFILGFEIVSLATPQAAMAGGLTLDRIKGMGWLSKPPILSPQIPGNDPLTVSVLGFLHSNCGNACHNESPSAFAGSTGLWMRLDVDSTGAIPLATGNEPDGGPPKRPEEATNTWTTAVGVVSNFTPQGMPQGSFMRIKRGDAVHSAIPYRDGRRDGVTQMPPLATHLVDMPDVKNLTDWVNGL